MFSPEGRTCMVTHLAVLVCVTDPQAVTEGEFKSRDLSASARLAWTLTRKEFQLTDGSSSLLGERGDVRGSPLMMLRGGKIVFLSSKGESSCERSVAMINVRMLELPALEST